MKTMERKKSQLIKYKMVNYEVKESAHKNEEEVEEEEEVGQEGDNDEQQTKNINKKNSEEKKRSANQIQDGKVSD